MDTLFGSRYEVTERTVASTSMLADTSIAITLAILLHRQKQKLDFANTNSMIDRIITYVICTGLITAGCALYGLVDNLLDPTQFNGVPVMQVIPKRQSSDHFASNNALNFPSFKSTSIA